MCAHQNTERLGDALKSFKEEKNGEINRLSKKQHGRDSTDIENGGMYMHVYIYVYIYICMYIYIYMCLESPLLPNGRGSVIDAEDLPPEYDELKHDFFDIIGIYAYKCIYICMIL
jgi:hypothetical protein